MDGAGMVCGGGSGVSVEGGVGGPWQRKRIHETVVISCK